LANSARVCIKGLQCERNPGGNWLVHPGGCIRTREVR
jgi:hypothetical protein